MQNDPNSEKPRVAEVSGTIDDQDVAGTVGSASLTSGKEATLTITKDYKVAQKRLTPMKGVKE